MITTLTIHMTLMAVIATTLTIQKTGPGNNVMASTLTIHMSGPGPN